MKRITNIITILSLTFAMMTAPVRAQSDIQIKVNGSPVCFDVAPRIIDGRTMVPIRAFFETIGATVTWDDTSKTAVAVNQDITVSMQLNSTAIRINDETKQMDCTPTIIDGRILVPARFAAEVFGYEVDWDDTEKTVNIEKTGEHYLLNACLGYESSQDKFGVFLSFQNEKRDYLKLHGAANINIVNENGECLFNKTYEFDDSMFFTDNDSLLCELDIPASEITGDRLGTGIFTIGVSTDDLYWDPFEITSELHGVQSNQNICDILTTKMGKDSIMLDAETNTKLYVKKDRMVVSISFNGIDASMEFAPDSDTFDFYYSCGGTSIEQEITKSVIMDNNYLFDFNNIEHSNKYYNAETDKNDIKIASLVIKSMCRAMEICIDAYSLSMSDFGFDLVY